jgi:hypothetical protein
MGKSMKNTIFTNFLHEFEEKAVVTIKESKTYPHQQIAMVFYEGQENSIQLIHITGNYRYCYSLTSNIKASI